MPVNCTLIIFFTFSILFDFWKVDYTMQVRYLLDDANITRAVNHLALGMRTYSNYNYQLTWVQDTETTTFGFSVFQVFIWQIAKIFSYFLEKCNFSKNQHAIRIPYFIHLGARTVCMFHRNISLSIDATYNIQMSIWLEKTDINTHRLVCRLQRECNNSPIFFNE